MFRPAELVDLLGGPGGRGDPPADLRHLVPRQQAAERVAGVPGGGGEARPSQDRTGEADDSSPYVGH